MTEGTQTKDPAVLALSGGVGGAKLALGLAKSLDSSRLTIVANTGDDFEHLGLHISPDLDTVMYTLAGLSNPETGWGRAGESWQFMEALRELGGEAWFQLGDQDLATHVERTRRLAAGEPLSEITTTFCRRLGIACRIVPMSNHPVHTIVHTPSGTLPFQHYFVRDRCEPTVTGFSFQGVENAQPSPGFEEAIDDPSVAAIVICPSNPFVSIDPILALPGVRSALVDAPAPIIAVSPIVAGRALKGPTAKMMAELDLPTTPIGVAQHYGDLLDGFVLDHTDSNLAPHLEAAGLRCLVTDTVMVTLADKITLAGAVLDIARKIAER